MVKPSIIFACLCAAAVSVGPGLDLVFANDVSAKGRSARNDMAMPVSAFLCDSSVHAVQFADIIAKGDGEELAKDRVGRMAKAEVCGRYSGIATIESESVTLQNGIAYKLTAFRFREDQKIAWLAETSFAPTPGAWDL